MGYRHCAQYGYLMSNTLLRASSINADERFWRRVRKTPYCWHWTGSKTRGYGMFSVHGRTVPAHVFAFVLHHGYWPKGDVCHGRDCERDCVNPDHLRDGTHSENMLDIQRHRREWIEQIAGLQGEISNLNFQLGFLEAENRCLDEENRNLVRKYVRLREFVDELMRLGGLTQPDLKEVGYGSEFRGDGQRKREWTAVATRRTEREYRIDEGSAYCDAPSRRYRN